MSMSLFDRADQPSPSPRRGRRPTSSRPRVEALEGRVVLSVTTTTLTPSVVAPTYGQPEVFTAQVTEDGGGTPPGGAVQFQVDGMNVGQKVGTSSASTATFNDSTLPVGPHTISAFYYIGGTTYDSSSLSSVTVRPAPTATTATASTPSATYGQSEALTATVVSSFPGQATPTGSVQFQTNGMAIGPALPLVAGMATLDTTAVPAGNNAIVAVYTPDTANFAASNNDATPAAVVTRPAPLAVAATSASFPYGTVNPTLTATYTGFVNGDTASSLTVPARVSTSANPLSPVGTYAITANGAVDHNYTITYTPATLTVTPAATTTTVTASAASSAYGNYLQFTANVDPVAPSTAITTGKVQFVIDGQNAGSPFPFFAGQASFSTNGLTAGRHTVAAVYTPATGNEAASDDRATPAVVTITPVATSASMATTTATALLHQSPTLIASVSPAPSSTSVPTGVVTFRDVTGGGNTFLGGGPVFASGGTYLGVFTTPAGLSQGAHTIVASYSGDANNQPSTSAPFTLTVRTNPVLADLNGDGKADLSVFGPIGSTGKYGFQTLTSSSGFNPAAAVVFDNYGYGFGNKSSIPVSADYFGEGKAAYALWTPNAGGMTFTAVSSVNPGESLTVNFGGTNDVPVIADVDGDGKADFGVYGYAPGLGYRFDFLLSSDKFNVTQQSIFNNYGYGYGNSQSIPVVADFDGSGRAGFGLYNPSATGSTFTYVSPSAGVSFSRTVGGPNDIPMAVSYDGDGRADLALYGPEGGGKYRYEVLTSSSGYDPARAVTFDNYGYGYGNAASIPVAADYEGTGKADLAVDTNAAFFTYQAGQTGAGSTTAFGVAGDIPLTAPSYLRARLVRGLA